MAEYFSPRAKQRLCFSQYKGADHMLGTLPQVSFFISLFFFFVKQTCLLQLYYLLVLFAGYVAV